MFLNSFKIGAEKGYLKKIIIEIIGLAMIVSFISNLYSFSLWIELLLIPIIALFAGTAALSQYKPKYNSAGIFSNRVITTIGLVIFCVSLYKTIAHFGDLATADTLREFALPILLSLMFIPFVYASSVYSRWELKKIREKYRAKTAK
jgi:hypothetical protein